MTQEFSPYPRPDAPSALDRTRRVLSRIRRNITFPEHSVDKQMQKKEVEKRADGIYQRLTDDAPALLAEYRKLKKSENVGKKELQDCLAAYLFSVFRTLSPEGRKKATEYERARVRVVAARLEGNDAQMKTGEGKSLAVLPIVAIVKMHTSAAKEAFLGSVTDNLCAELVSNIDLFASHFRANYIEDLAFDVDDFAQGKVRDGGYLNEDLSREMQKTALLKGAYSPALEAQIRDRFWTHTLSHPPEKSLFTREPDTKGVVNPRVLVAHESDFVFAYGDDPKKFLRRCPTIDMDEIDTPAVRGTAYHQVEKGQYFTAASVEDMVCEYLTYFIVANQLKEKDFERVGGAYRLKEEAEGLIKSIPRLLRENSEDMRSEMRRGAMIIADHYSLTEEKRRIFLKRIEERYFERLKDADEKGETIVLNIANLIASIYDKNGSMFIHSEDGSLVVRDEYIDTLLTGHEFDPETQLAIRALNGTFRFIRLDQRGMKTTTYHTFAAALGDRFGGVSGTLLYPDLKTGETRETPFARLLHEIKGRIVIEASMGEPKKIPRPQLFEDAENTVSALLADLEKDARPTLVITHNMNDAAFLRERLKEKTQVLYVSPGMTEEDIKKACVDLAEARGVMVSSGQMGVGINILKEDRSFPDLRIFICNLTDLPPSRAIVRQDYGRRRADGGEPGKEFNWYVAAPALDRAISLFSEPVPDRVMEAMGAKDREILERDVERYMWDPKRNKEKIFDLILLFLERKEASAASGDELVLAYDREFATWVEPQFKKKVEEWWTRWALDHMGDAYPPHYLLHLTPSRWLDLKQHFTSGLGIDSRLYWKLLEQLRIEGSLRAAKYGSIKIRDWPRLVLPDLLEARATPDSLPRFDDLVDRWCRVAIPAASEEYTIQSFEGRLERVRLWHPHVLIPVEGTKAEGLDVHFFDEKGNVLERPRLYHVNVNGEQVFGFLGYEPGRAEIEEIKSELRKQSGSEVSYTLFEQTIRKQFASMFIVLGRVDYVADGKFHYYLWKATDEEMKRMNHTDALSVSADGKRRLLYFLRRED